MPSFRTNSYFVEPMTGSEPVYSAWEEGSIRLLWVAGSSAVPSSARPIRGSPQKCRADCTCCDSGVTPSADVSTERQMAAISEALGESASQLQLNHSHHHRPEESIDTKSYLPAAFVGATTNTLQTLGCTFAITEANGLTTTPAGTVCVGVSCPNGNNSN